MPFHSPRDSDSECVMCWHTDCVTVTVTAAVLCAAVYAGYDISSKRQAPVSSSYSYSFDTVIPHIHIET